MEDLLFQFRNEEVIHLAANDLIKTRSNRLLFPHGLYHLEIRYRSDLANDLLISGRRDLGAVLPIHFISIVLRRIMARRYHYACRTTECSQRKGKLRRGAKTLEDKCFDAIGGKAKRRLLGKLRAHAAIIKRNGNTLILRALLYDIISKTLGCLSHGIDVHAVRARRNHTAKAARTKLQLAVKAILHLSFIISNG